MSTREHLTVGIDPGSSAVKVAIMKSRAGSDAKLLAQSVQRIRRRKVADVVSAGFEEACAAAGVGPRTSTTSRPPATATPSASAPATSTA